MEYLRSARPCRPYKKSIESVRFRRLRAPQPAACRDAEGLADLADLLALSASSARAMSASAWGCPTEIFIQEGFERRPGRGQETLKEHAKIEQSPRIEGKQIVMMVVPK